MSVHPSTIHVTYDFICPWCWIGMRHLFAACKVLRADQPELVIDVHWHAATLLPYIPEQGVPYQTFYVNRLGSAAAVAARREQVQASASTVGLTLNFEAIEMFPNTGLVCAMVNLAQEQLDAQAMYFFVESIFAAYFMHGKDIGSMSTLRELADPAVFNRAAVGEWGGTVTWGTDALELAADNLRARAAQ